MLLVMLACLSSVGRGEGPEDARALAVQLTSDGAAAYKAQEFAKAIDKFSAAYRLYPAAPLLLNLSRAELKLSRCAEAIRHAEMFRTVVGDSLANSADSPDEWLTTVQRSCIEAVVHSFPPGATIFIDGERQTSPDSTPWKGRLTAGSHKVLLWRDGYQKATAYLDVSADSPASLDLTLIPAITEAAVAQAPALRPVDIPTPAPPLIPVPFPEPAAQIAAAPQPALTSVRPVAEPSHQMAVRAPLVFEPPRQSSVAAPSLQLLPPQAATHEDVTAKKISNPVLRNLGYTGIAIGGAALIVAIVLGVTVQENTLGIGQRAGQRTTAQASADLSSSRSEATATNVLFVVGGVLAAAGIPLAVVF